MWHLFSDRKLSGSKRSAAVPRLLRRQTQFAVEHFHESLCSSIADGPECGEDRGRSCTQESSHQAHEFITGADEVAPRLASTENDEG
jgi:hypothetical protein